MRDKQSFIRIFRTLCVCIGLGVIPLSGMDGDPDSILDTVGHVYAQEDWRKEFDDVCSKTQDAMVIPPGDLKNLVDRCDRLKPKIEKLDESQRKVFLKRLQLCRDLYLFVLETREKKQ